jgi:hypothetical protein
LRGQIFPVVLLFGGKSDSTQKLILLPSGGQQLISMEWTEQYIRMNYPRGSGFVFDHLIMLQKRLDDILSKEANETILTDSETQFDRSGGSHAKQRSANFMEAEVTRATRSDLRDPGPNSAALVDSTTGGVA